MKPYWRDAFEFLYYTGLRRGELIYLEWNDLNLDPVSPTVTIQSKPEHPLKTNQERVIPLNAKMIELLERQTRPKDHNWVFKAKTGGIIDPDKLYHGLAVALKKLGLEGNVHKFRHSFASQLVMDAASLEAVSKLLGHSSIEMTMIYAHLSPDHLRVAVNKLTLD